MFNFLFRRKNGKVETKIETQREVIARALDEVNDLIALMDPKPAITIEPSSGQISLALPEQMPDEALALPAPGAGIDKETDSRKSAPQDKEDAPASTKADAAPSEDAKSETA